MTDRGWTMPLPFFYHLRNAGGNSFFRAVGSLRVEDDDILVINDEGEFARQRHRLEPAPVSRLTFALGHAIHLAEPWIADRYEMTMLRWPQAVFCADSINAHEHPPYSAIPEIWGIADDHARLRAYLHHLENGGAHHHLRPVVGWLDMRHGIGCGDAATRDERLAAVDRCDALLRDYYRFVGITELMDESLILFQLDFPDRRVTPWVRSRVNKKRLDPFTLPADIVGRFEHEYAADLVLYERARRRLLERFAGFWRARPELHDYYLGFKTAMILTDPLLMARFAAADPLYFPLELPLEELRALVVSKLDRAQEIRANIMRAYG